MVKPRLQNEALKNSLTTIAQDRIEKRISLTAPLANELVEYWKNSGAAKDLQSWTNDVWRTYLKEQALNP